MIFELQNYNLRKGYYQKAHGLIELAERGVITKGEYILLDLLLHLENRFNKNAKLFYRSDADIIKINLISQKTLTIAKKGLLKKGLIFMKKGNSHRATEYKILIQFDINGNLSTLTNYSENN